MHGKIKNRRKATLILIAALLAMGCTSAQQCEGILGITVLYRSPTCEGFCRIQLTANKDKKVMIETPGIDTDKETDRTLKRKWVRLNSADWNRLLGSFSLEEVKALPEISGCPGCDDKNPAGNLILVTDSLTYQKAFEAQDPPKAIKSLTKLIAEDLIKIEDRLRWK